MHCDQVQNVQQVYENDAISEMYASTYCIKDALLDAHTQRIENKNCSCVVLYVFVVRCKKPFPFHAFPFPI